MTTIVGTQKSFIDAVKELVELEYDALAAYEVALKNIQDSRVREALEGFLSDHRAHIQYLTEFLSRCNEIAPTGPGGIKGLMAKSSAQIAALLGDYNILSAMLSNEHDTNTAYERMVSRLHESTDQEVASALADGLVDERRHKDWLLSEIAKTDRGSKK